MSDNDTDLKNRVDLAIESNLGKNEMQTMLDQAIRNKSWAAVKVICDMKDSHNKPSGANKEIILKRAIDDEDWQSVYDIEFTFKNIEYVLTEGPIQKSEYTISLENLARKLIKNNEFEIKTEGDEDYFEFSDGKKFNWTQIRTHANLQHITLGEEDFVAYEEYMKSAIEKEGVTIQKDKEEEYIKALYGEYIKQKKEIPASPICFAEMQAINIYTGGFFVQMSGLMRGDLNKFNYKTEDKAITRSALIQSVMCASGLTKIPESSIKTSYRAPSAPRNLEEHVKAAATGGVVSLSGFVSTSIDDLDPEFELRPVHYILHNVRGVYIAPISSMPPEKEFLMASTQVQLTKFKKSEAIIFEGTCVSPLSTFSIENSKEVTEDTSKNMQKCKQGLQEIKSSESKDGSDDLVNENKLS